MESGFDPTIPTELVTERNVRVLFALIVFWSIGGLFPVVFWPQSYVNIKVLENNTFPEDQKYKFDKHMSSKDVYSYIKRFALFYSHKVKILTLHPRTYENRSIKVIKLSMPQYDTRIKKKGTILAVAGVAGCIWDSVSAAIHLMHKLTEECHYKVPYLLEYDWYIIPIYNPDGYDYTLEEREVRLARFLKNRAPYTVNNKTCRGVYIDRNFGFHWGESKLDDYSDPCVEGFAGTHPFSENEVLAMKRFVEGLYKRRQPIKMYLQIHGSLHFDDITFPWRFTKVPTFNKAVLETMGRTAAEEVSRLTGSYFRSSQSGVIDHASGLFSDWLMGVRQVMYLFSLEPTYAIFNSSDAPDQQLYTEKISTIVFSLMKQLRALDSTTSSANLNLVVSHLLIFIVVIKSIFC